MTQCNDQSENNNNNNNDRNMIIVERRKESLIRTCPSCGHHIKCQDQGGIHELPGLPAGVKFDPTDQEILEHLEAKLGSDIHKLHPLIDEFIPTLEGQNGICYTHPEKLPGVRKDGVVRHFFHRPSKAYTTGTRKRRKVQTEEEDGSETRWHKTGKTRGVYTSGNLVGYKKILVLYTNYGKHRKPEKTSWVMHQYHLGFNEEEKEGELVLSKVFYQTQPRHCAAASTMLLKHHNHPPAPNHGGFLQFYNNNNSNNSSNFLSFDHHPPQAARSPTHPHHVVSSHFPVVQDASSFIP